MSRADLAKDLFDALRDVYFLLSRRRVLDKYVMGLIRIVTKISWCLGCTLTRKHNRLNRGEANKIEAIAGLSQELETLVGTVTKSRELEKSRKLESEESDGEESDGELGERIQREKILVEKIIRAIKPLLWITCFSDSRLHEDLIDYEKRKWRRRNGIDRKRFRDPNEILILYSECCFDVLMESEGRILRELREKEAPKQDP